MQYSKAQHTTVQHSILQEYSTVNYSTVQYSTAYYRRVQHSAAQHSIAQHSTAQHSIAQYPTSASCGLTAAHSMRYFAVTMQNSNSGASVAEVRCKEERVSVFVSMCLC